MNNSAPAIRPDSDAHKAPLWRKTIATVVKYAIPLGISVGLILWLFHRVDIHEVGRIIRNGCNYRWIILMMIITMFSHIIRGIRWGIQLRGAGIPRMTWLAESVSIFGAYALNLVVPHGGEVWRCIYVAKKENTPISTVVGTDFGDRISDAVVVVMLTGIALITARPAMVSFLHHYKVGRDITHITDDPLLWSGLAVAITTVWAILHFMRKNKYIGEINLDLKRIWDGFKILFTMKGRGLYVILTFGIWGCYFLETYVCFFAFPFTKALIHTHGLAFGLIPGLVTFVFGSFSMAIPSNGGLGPWNLAVMFALSLYGISDAEGTAFSIVMWSFQAAMLVALGIFSAIYVMYTSKKEKTPEKQKD